MASVVALVAAALNEVGILDRKTDADLHRRSGAAV
jgi:hypothetical protein